MAVEVTWLVHTLCCSGTILMNLLLGAIIIKTILKYNRYAIAGKKETSKIIGRTL